MWWMNSLFLPCWILTSNEISAENFNVDFNGGVCVTFSQGCGLMHGWIPEIC